MILKDSGHPGLLLVLDEVETLQRIRADIRDKSLNALRQLMEEIDSGRFPGLYLLITGQLGGKVGIAPPVLLQKLVGDVLDRVDQFDDFDPRQHYALTLDERELTPVERAARSARSVDDIELDLQEPGRE